NCSTAATIEAGAQGNLILYSVADARRDLNLPDTCLIDFSLSGSGALFPTARVVNVNSVVQEHTEAFAYDDVSPQIQFKSVAITSDTGAQKLVVSLDANDDTDVQYL